MKITATRVILLYFIGFMVMFMGLMAISYGKNDMTGQSMMLLFLFYLALPKPDLSTQLASQLLPACAGNGVQGAAAYPVDQTQPATVILHLRDYLLSEAAIDNLPEQPSLSDVQAVVCYDYSEVILDYCNYDIVVTGGNGGTSHGSKSIARIRADLNGTLVEALTGKTITTFTLAGGVPDHCPDPKDVTVTTSEEMSFGTAGINEVKAWLANRP
jgi:hypothetical protein